MRDDINKIPVAIYRVDPEAPFMPDSFDSAVEYIVGNYNKRSGGKGRKYSEESLLAESLPNWCQVRLYTSKYSKPPKWLPFLDPIFTRNGVTVLSDTSEGSIQNVEFSFVCFVGYGAEIFAIAGGQGSAVIQRYIDSSFGLNILSRLISLDDRVVKMLQARGVTGSTLGNTKFFRGNQRLASEDRFGKVYSLIRVSLKKSVLVKEFGFKEQDFKRMVSGCLAKASFQISKAMTFDQLIEVVRHTAKLLEDTGRHPSVINKVRMLGRSAKDSELVSRLKKRLFETLLEVFRGDAEHDFDLCHAEMDRYLTAESYELFFGKKSVATFDDGEIPSLSRIVESLNAEESFRTDDLEGFMRSVAAVTIRSVTEGESAPLEGTLMSHVHGEVSLDGRDYFRLDSKWHEIDGSFISDLNDLCDDTVGQAWKEDLLSVAFEKEDDEQVYIERYLGHKPSEIYVLHKVIIEGIELCDILIKRENKVYLVHVKVGFENSIRELSAQLKVSAQRLAHDLRKGKEFLKKVDKLATQPKAGASDYRKRVSSQARLAEEGLRGIFENINNKDVIFCFAFVDSLNGRTLKNNATSFKSNIAKISLVDLSREIYGLGFGFAVAQIQRA